MKQIFVREYGIIPENRKENAWNLRKMLQAIRNEHDIEIIFEEGTYHFYPDYANEKLLYISNHDEDTIKKVAFDLTGMRRVSILGQNTQFMFHTDIIPFHIDQCEEIKIEGITIDYWRTGYSEGKIVELSDTKMVLEIDREKYPYRVVHNKIYFEEEKGLSELYCGCLEMDGERNAPVYQGHDISFNKPYASSYGACFREAGENLLEIELTEDQKFLKTSRVGNYMVLRHHWRTHPCFYITNSKDISLKNINIYHCTGMAVIVQFTENIVLDEVNVCINPQKKRCFTATADGFHFVYAKGKIHIKNCLLENQLDDPVNIHGIYGRIHKVLNKREVLVELVEGMQKGVKLGDQGDVFSVINNVNMMECEQGKIQSLEMLNKDYMFVVFEEEMEHLKPGFVVENRSYVPDVLIEGCTFRNNRARGLLLTSAGEVVVRNNYFSTPGSAILVEGDSNYWFESGATNHIVIEENEFVDCAYVSDWGKAPIQVSPSAEVWEEEERYHQCLEIRRNTFKCFDERLVNAMNLKMLIFEQNKIEKTGTFPKIPGNALELDGILEVKTDLKEK